MSHAITWRCVTFEDLYARVKAYARQHGRCFLYLVGEEWVMRPHPCNQIADDLVGDFQPTCPRARVELLVASTILSMVRK